jgi:hypothetical protein
MRAVRRALAAGTSLLVLLAAAPAQAAISYVNSNGATSTTTTLTITKPTNTTTNDVLVATVAGAGTAIMNAPSGWINLRDTTATGSGMRVMTFYKVATSTEGANYAFTTASARNWGGNMIALRGANQVVPIDTSATATGASGNVVAPAVTTTSANQWIVTSATANRNTTFTAPAGATERIDTAGTSTSTELSTTTLTTAGAVAAKTATPANTTSSWVGNTIAVRAATTAGLSVSLASPSEVFSADLNSGDSTQTYTSDITVDDTRTTASAGWQLQVTSTTLTTGTHSLDTASTSVSGVSGLACDNNGPCTLPTNNVTYPVTVPAASVAPTAVKFANAAAGTGTGRMDWTASFDVDVPQNAFAGTYTSTLTISVVSGP